MVASTLDILKRMSKCWPKAALRIREHSAARSWDPEPIPHAIFEDNPQALAGLSSSSKSITFVVRLEEVKNAGKDFLTPLAVGEEVKLLCQYATGAPPISVRVETITDLPDGLQEVRFIRAS